MVFVNSHHFYQQIVGNGFLKCKTKRKWPDFWRHFRRGLSANERRPPALRATRTKEPFSRPQVLPPTSQPWPVELQELLTNNNAQAKATALFKLVTAKSLAFRCTFQLEALYLVIVPTYLFAVFFFSLHEVLPHFLLLLLLGLVVCVLPAVTRDVVCRCILLNVPACAITKFTYIEFSY